MIRVAICDEHELVRLGLSCFLDKQHDLELVCQAASYQALLQACSLAKPDIILLEITEDIEVLNDLLPEIAKVCSSILVLTACKDRQKQLQVLRLGAVGIVFKDQSLSILNKAIHALHGGEVWVDRDVSLELLRNSVNADLCELSVNTIAEKKDCNPYHLTPRELEITMLAANGLPAKAIAAKLFVSEKTIRNQLVVIYQKLGVSSQVELVVQMCREGLNTLHVV
ncbi:response regulator transcription factor [Methylomonas sp. AM2-LC]|uniref:response regulator transcription factor n=1 Tax=Methylomonas sp. AM2-LC TaxID=3153301 RepID=UPI0032672BE5